jgi:hypothetical protein
MADESANTKPGPVTKAFWQVIERIQGKESADLAAKSFAAYSQGNLKEGASLGIQANEKTVMHMAGAVKNHFGGIVGGAVGQELQNHITGVEHVSEQTRPLTTPANAKPKEAGKLIP